MQLYWKPALACLTAICLSNFISAQPPEPPGPRTRPPTTPQTGPRLRPEPAVRENEPVLRPRGLGVSDPRRHPRVALEISTQNGPLGTIVVELYPERTPTTARTFLRYVDEGFYDGTIFHRILPDFVIQGGQYVDPTTKKTDGLHGEFRNESRRGLKNERGTIGMARRQDPHSAVCQFYINVVDNPQLDYGQPSVGPYGYCVFGKVIAGLDVVDRIARLPTVVSPAAQRRFERYREQGIHVEKAEQSQPTDPPMIKRARRLEGEEYSRYDVSPEPVTQPIGDDPPPPVEPEELPIEPEELPIEPEELPIEPEELPIEPEELPIEPEDLPAEEPTLPEEDPLAELEDESTALST